MWVLVRAASQRQFKRVPTFYVLRSNMKNIRFVLSENFPFLVVKFSIYLNTCVFVMLYTWYSHTDTAAKYANNTVAAYKVTFQSLILKEAFTIFSWFWLQIAFANVRWDSFIVFALRKHAYSNILNILPPKNENFQIKNSDSFLFLLKTQIVDNR